MRTRRVTAAGIAMVAALGLAACGSGSSGDAASSAPAVASLSALPDDAGLGTPEMKALCDDMVADGLSVDDATALAEDNGYVARVGSIDGEGQALTMDLREDRFTFEVEGGAVVGCTYG
jgi:hypothetical protein